ncbi:hypothetical protein C6X96_08105 [Bacillus pumilus]|nr:hypothetical protein C6X96_08105 [Bacillus pumilus]PRS65822.1 hypothetical protein C6X97_05535 [Bacillus pumilus]
MPFLIFHNSFGILDLLICTESSSLKKRTPINALKVLNDWHPQILPSGQNFHVRFACFFHTMTHIGKKVTIHLFVGFLHNLIKTN